MLVDEQPLPALFHGDVPLAITVVVTDATLARGGFRLVASSITGRLILAPEAMVQSGHEDEMIGSPAVGRHGTHGKSGKPFDSNRGKPFDSIVQYSKL